MASFLIHPFQLQDGYFDFCFMLGTRGVFRHTGRLNPGNYVFRIIAYSMDGERVVERRRLFIGEANIIWLHAHYT